MRTTLDIDNDVLQAAKEMACRDGTSAGQVISNLARKGLSSSSSVADGGNVVRNGIPVLPPTGEVITVEKVNEIMEQEGV